VTASSMIPTYGLWRAGKAVLEGPRLLKYGINFLVGFPGTVAGLLDPHVSESGGLASSLGESE
jgi:hypothetical protein